MESDSSRSTPTRQHNLLTSTLRTHTRMLLLALLTSTCLLTLTSAQPSFDSSTGAVQPDNFNPSDIPLSPPENIIYGDKGCQFIQQWDGPQCAAGFECISETLAAPQEENDDKFHLTYQQEQCLFCIFSSYCSPRQKDACKQLSVIEPDFNIANIVNRTLGVGTCKACKEGQYCPATTGTNATATTAAMASKGSINPFGLAIINLCAEGSYCPSSTQQLTCPQGFFCPMGTKFPFACTALGTFCAPGSNSPSKLCRGGRYCPDPQTEIECPSGHFCKAGAIAPKKCTVLASCPAGSAAALLVWQGIIFVILIYLALAAVYYTTRFIQKRRRKREAAAAAKRAEGAEVVQLLKSLRTFQNLEAMHAQQTGMTPHTGRGRNGYTPGGNSTTPMVSSGRGMAKAAAGGAFGAGMHGGDGAKTPDYGNKHSVAPEDVDYTIAKTVDGNFAVVKHSKEEESALVRAGIASPKDQTKEEVIGVVKNKHTVSHEHDTELVKAENHEDIGVVMPEKSVEHHVVLPMSARGANGQHSEQHADENDVEMTRSTPRNIPSAINIKTDADIDTGAAVNDDDDDDGDSVDEDEDDDLTGFDPIPIPVTLTFDKLGLKLKNGTEVLKGVSGEFPHSRLTALMGPSGAGKSTFLNVLCGKASYGEMTGSIMLNDVPTTISAVKSVTGFVPQDDVMHADLTCYENLYYQAMLRLPRNMPYSQKKQIIEDAVKMLGLEAVQHSVVGSVEKRGISGGQRKRVNIGLEVVCNCTLLFMDEPTSGLDSTASLEVLSALRDLTDLGVSIITVIHQPRFSIVELFHSMLLLGKGGQSVFLGNSTQALNYFTDLGFQLPANENPADFFLDIISGEIRREGDPDFQPSDLFELWEVTGDWVRRGEEVPPYASNELLMSSEDEDENGREEGSKVGSGKYGEYLTSPGPDGMRQRAPPSLNVVTPRSPHSPNRMPYGYQFPLRSNPVRFATFHSSGAQQLALPAAGEFQNQRAQTGMSDASSHASMRSPVQMMGPYGTYWHPAAMPPVSNTHKRTRSTYHALNAYRAGVTRAEELPLPKHRELLYKFGKEGIGQLVQEYTREQAHHSTKHGVDRMSNHHHFGREDARKAAAGLGQGKATPGSRSAKKEAEDAMRSPGVARPGQKPILRQVSQRRLNMLFDRQLSTRNLASARGGPQTARFGRTMSLNSGMMFSPGSNTHSNHGATGRLPTIPGSFTEAQDGSDAPSGSASPAASGSSSVLPTQPRNHLRTQSALGAVVESNEDEEAPVDRARTATFKSPPTRSRSPSRSKSVHFHDDSPAPDVRYDGHIKYADFPMSTKAGEPTPLTKEEQEKIDRAAAYEKGEAMISATEVTLPAAAFERSASMPMRPSHSRANSLNFTPALASIPSEGEGDSARASASPESQMNDQDAKLAAALRSVAEKESGATTASTSSSSAHQSPAHHSPSTRIQVEDPQGNVTLSPQPKQTEHLISDSTVAKKNDDQSIVASKSDSVVFSKDEQVAHDMVDISGVLPPPRQLPYMHVQFLYLLQRQSLKLMRGMGDVVFDMSLTVAVGLAIGLIFGGVWSLNGYATICTLAVLSLGVLSAVSALKMFGHDRVVHWREASSGISITAYWLAVTLMHLPLTVIFSFLFVAPYWNLILPDVSFQDTWWVFIAIHFACSGAGMLFSVAFSPIPALLSGVMVPLIIGGFLNGVSPALADQGSVMRALCDMSYSRYGVEAFMIQQLNVQPDYAYPIVDSVYSNYGFDRTHFSYNIGILFIIGLILRFCTLLSLHFLNRDKRI